MKRVQIAVRINKEDVDCLDRIAKEKDRSRESLLRVIIKEFLKGN